MKRFLSCAVLALGAAALLGLTGGARADGPAPLPKGTQGAPAAPAAPAPLPGAPVMTPPPAAVVASVPAACCTEPCEEPHLKKVCVGEKATRPKTTRVYGEICEDFCVPKCVGHGHGHGHDDCGDCSSGGCSDEGCTECEHHARTRKYLVVRIKTEEECYTKCHVEYQVKEKKCKAPKCHDEGCCNPGCAGVVVTPGTPVQVSPLPPMEKLPQPKDK